MNNFVTSKASENVFDLRRQFEPAVHWFSLAPGYRSPLFRDSHLNIIECFTHYTNWLASNLMLQKSPPGAFASRMNAAAPALRDLECFLAKRKLTWRDIDDTLLADYREWSLATRIARGKIKDDLSAKRSTNEYLREVYRLLHWAQSEAHLVLGMIGESKCRVRSSLTSVTARSNSRGTKERKSQKKYRYPLLYRGIGEASRRSSSNYWAKQEDLDKIEEHFLATSTPHVAQRNIVIMHLINVMAWRVSSIHSLNKSDFTGELEETDDGDVLVKPAFQKRGNQFSFPVPYQLLRMIREYISDGRQQIVNQHGEKGDDALFLSDTSGCRVAKSTITQIFMRAFDAIGVAVPNAATHAIRRKSAVDKIDTVYEYRKQHNLPTGEEDIKFESAKHLGHESHLAGEAYRQRESRAIKESVAARQQRTILAKDAENFALRMEIQRLRDDAAKSAVAGSETVTDKKQ
jgi:hypothetical protein